MQTKPILVSKPSLPPIATYLHSLQKIWKSSCLSNGGQFVQELEESLKEYLNAKHVFFVSNGTVALTLALRAMGISKKIITTPFSYVASLDVILWEGCTPVFADIDPKTYCLDPKAVERVIDKDVQAILPVHVYGYPCDVRAYEDLAKRYNLKVLYDAAHAFGTTIDGQAVTHFGDVSALSFHATKLFHTAEGGAVVTNDDNIAKNVAHLRNFGYENGEIVSLGINAKGSELHAALGLSQLPKVEKYIRTRCRLVEAYDQILCKFVDRPLPQMGCGYNFAYYPIVLDSEEELIAVTHKLEENDIHPRRYFYPSLNTLPFLKADEASSCPISEDLSRRVLCLPLYSDLHLDEVLWIGNLVAATIKRRRRFQKKSLFPRFYPLIDKQVSNHEYAAVNLR